MFAQGRENSKYETGKSEGMAVMLAQYLVHRHVLLLNVLVPSNQILI
jgi:hypothetical protein